MAATKRWLMVGVVALAALSCSSAPEMPPRVIPAIVAETFVIFIVAPTTLPVRESYEMQLVLDVA